MSSVIKLGPLDEKETTAGADRSSMVVLFSMAASGLLSK